MIPLFHKGVTVFFNFFKKSATKRLLAYRYGARKGNLTFFQNNSLNRVLLSLYGVKEEKFWKNVGKSSWVDSVMWKEENLFIFNLTFGSCRSLYGAKKIFHSIVGSNGVAWVVRVWKRKLFIINLAEWHFLSLYGAGKESLTIFILT